MTQRSQAPAPQALATLVERGILYACPDRPALDAILGAPPAAAVLRLEGDALGLGDLVRLMALRALQRAGHKPVILLGPGAGEAARREARVAARLAHCLRFGAGPADAAVLDTARWRDGLRERAAWPGPDAAVPDALDTLEVARRFGPVVRVAALDEAGDLAAGLALARRLGTDAVGFTTVLPRAERLRLADGTRAPLAGAPWRQAHPDDVPRLLRLLTDLPLPRIRAWAQGGARDLDTARAALAEAVGGLVGEEGYGAELLAVA